MEDRKQWVQLNGYRLNWTEVRKDVLQGSVLGPFLFTIFINDIDEIVYDISKFADDTKIASWINTLNDIRSMQRTLDKLVVWANMWEMDFNINKCGIMQFQYQMNDGGSIQLMKKVILKCYCLRNWNS